MPATAIGAGKKAFDDAVGRAALIDRPEIISQAIMEPNHLEHEETGRIFNPEIALGD